VARLQEQSQAAAPWQSWKAEVTKLSKDLAEACMERDVLKSGSVLCSGAAARYAQMKTLRFE